MRFLSGTDDNSLKNALAAEEEGVPTQQLVDRNAAAFYDLRGPLQISFDDFIRTNGDPRHPSGVERLWHATAASDDLYQKYYEPSTSSPLATAIGNEQNQLDKPTPLFLRIETPETSTG